MALKTLPIKKGLLWKEWKNHYLIIAAFSGVITMAHPINLLWGITRYKGVPADAEYNFGMFPFVADVIDRLFMSPANGFIGFLSIIIIVTLASLLLGDERRQNTYEVLLSMPYTRQQIFFNKYLFGVSSIVLIYLINGLLLVAIAAANPGLLEYISYSMLIGWAIAQMVLLVTIFSFTFVFGAITGTAIANGILAGIFLIFPAGFALLILQTLAVILNSWPRASQIMTPYMDLSEKLSLFLYMFDKYAVLKNWYILLGASLLMYFLALKLFENNPMEKNGELLMFSTLEPVLKIGVAVCFMLLIGSITAGGFDESPLIQILCFLGGGIMGWIIVHYAVNRKTTQV